MNDPESIYIHYYLAAVARLKDLLGQSGQEVPARSRIEAHLRQMQQAHLAIGNAPAAIPLPTYVAEEAARLVAGFDTATAGASRDRAVGAAAALADGWERLPEFVDVPTRGGPRRLDILGRWPFPDQPAPAPRGERERDARGDAGDDAPATRG